MRRPNLFKLSGLMIVCAIISFGSAYIRDLLQQQFPDHALAIGRVGVVVFAVLLVYLVIAPAMRLCGIPALKRSGDSP
jgi:hypothetical protein